MGAGDIRRRRYLTENVAEPLGRTGQLGPGTGKTMPVGDHRKDLRRGQTYHAFARLIVRGNTAVYARTS